MEVDSSPPRHTCLKLEIASRSDSGTEEFERLFVKGTWYSSRFDIAITDGLNAWTCNASEEDIKERASQWDQPVPEYIDLSEKYLGFQQPGSLYGFSDAGTGFKRLSWTFEKEGIKLEWRWKCQPSIDSKKITAGILDFLMDSNIQLSEEVVQKSDSFERLKLEAEKCLSQNEELSKEKAEFESEIYAKFVAVLNSKKAKLRELRGRLSKQKSTEGPDEEGEESTDRTESFDEEESDGGKSEEESKKKVIGTSKNVTPSRSRGRKRK